VIRQRGRAKVRSLTGPSKTAVPFASARIPPDGSVVDARVVDGSVRRCKQLARPDSALAQLYALAAEHQLDPAFPPEVESEVAALLQAPGIDDPTLRDMTKLPFVSIDGPGTRDLDQALYIDERDGQLVAYYALADPSWCVRPGTALFDEALRRGATYYMPGLAIPMLPRALSEGIVSLNEGQARRAMVFVMRVDQRGRCVKTTIERARIRSRAQLTFRGVQRHLDDPKGHPMPRGVSASLKRLRKLGELRMRDAERRDVVRYRRTEVSVKLDDKAGMRFAIMGDARGPVERYNEQLSLLCNVEGARFLRKGAADTWMQAIFRVHPTPTARRYEELERMLRATAKKHRLDRGRWVWSRDDPRSLADFLDALPRRGRLGRVARAVHRQAVLINERSIFSSEPARHHGVGADVYARFSAPMREVVGVFLHKETWERLARKPDPPAHVLGEPMDDDELRERVVLRANDAKELQRRLTKEANRLVIDQLLGDDASRGRGDRPWRRGTLMGFTESRAHVRLDQPPVEVKVYRRHLESSMRCKLKLSEDGIEWRRDDGNALCAIGDEVEVRVHSRDRRGDRWALGLRRRR
jgi:ribonuclease R